MSVSSIDCPPRIKSRSHCASCLQTHEREILLWSVVSLCGKFCVISFCLTAGSFQHHDAYSCMFRPLADHREGNPAVKSWESGLQDLGYFLFLFWGLVPSPHQDPSSCISWNCCKKQDAQLLVGTDFHAGVGSVGLGTPGQKIGKSCDIKPGVRHGVGSKLDFEGWYHPKS